MLFTTAYGQSWLTCPQSLNPAQIRAGNRVAACEALTVNSPINNVNPGDRLKVGWPSNNRAGGYVRLGLIPFSNSIIESQFEQNVIKVTCFGNSLAGQSANGDCIHPCNARAGCAFQKTSNDVDRYDTTIKIPLNLAAGKYVLQWNGVVGTKLTPYFSCSIIQIVSDGPFVGKTCKKSTSPSSSVPSCLNSGGPPASTIVQNTNFGNFCFADPNSIGATNVDIDIGVQPVNFDCDPRVGCTGSLNPSICVVQVFGIKDPTNPKQICAATATTTKPVTTTAKFISTTSIAATTTIKSTTASKLATSSAATTTTKLVLTTSALTTKNLPTKSITSKTTIATTASKIYTGKPTTSLKSTFTTTKSATPPKPTQTSVPAAGCAPIKSPGSQCRAGTDYDRCYGKDYLSCVPNSQSGFSWLVRSCGPGTVCRPLNGGLNFVCDFPGNGPVCPVDNLVGVASIDSDQVTTCHSVIESGGLCVNGDYQCSGNGFVQCDNNKWINMDCAAGTICRPDSITKITCDLPDAVKCENAILGTASRSDCRLAVVTMTETITVDAIQTEDNIGL